MNYRPEIDGLRALAVVPVILFHAGFKQFQGGFVGVDIFFVISGYLIASIILHEQLDGTFSLVDFYERRARRILPALFTVSGICIPFAWVLLPPDQLKEFGNSLSSVSIFISNIFFWRTSGYFETETELKPLLHTWSLAIEEQYYLIFPILMIAVTKRFTNSLFLIIIALTLGGLCLAEWGWQYSPKAAFFLAPTRAWELLSGVACAIYLQKWPVSHTWVNSLCATLGLVLIAVSVYCFDKNTPFPGLYALVPVGGTALIILHTSPQSQIGKFLSNRCLVGIGLISYGAYLWHQPLLAYFRAIKIEEPKDWELGLVILASFSLAYAMWKHLEQPIKRKEIMSRRVVFLLSLVVSFSLFLIGIGLSKYGSVYKITQLESILATQGGSKNLFIVRREKQSESWKYSKEMLTPFLNNSGKKILIIGDSHSKDLFNVLRQEHGSTAESAQIRRVQFDDSCLKVMFGEERNQWGCIDIQKHQLFLDSDIVIFSSRWYSPRQYESDAYIHLPKFNRVIKSFRKKLVIVGSTPEFPPVPKLILQFILGGNNLKDLGSHSFEYRIVKIDDLNRNIKSIALKEGITYLDKKDYACNVIDRICWVINEEFQPLYYDGDHYTIEGARFFREKIMESGWFKGLDN